MYKLPLFILLFSAFSFAQIQYGTVLSLGQDAWVDFGDRESLDIGTEDFTISTWFRSASGGRQQMLLRKGKDNRTANEGRWVLKIHDNNVLKVVLNDDQNSSGTTFAVEGTTQVTDGLWHHVAAVFDRDAGLSVYLDGQIEISDSNLVDHSDNLFNVVDVFTGRSPAGLNSFYFDGEVDEMRVWNRARSESQILATMNDTLGTAYYATPDSGLIAYWRFDEAEGTIAFDLTENSNHGLLIGAEFSNPILVGSQQGTAIKPESFVLEQNHPNPFNPQTTISYTLNTTGNVELAIYNTLGQHLATLTDQRQTAGSYSTTFKADNYPSGTYYYRLRLDGLTQTKGMILVR